MRGAGSCGNGSGLTKRSQAATEHDQRHPQVTNGTVHEGVGSLDGGLEGQGLAAGSSHSSPASLNEGEPQDVVGHVGKPERPQMTQLSHVVQAEVLGSEVGRQPNCG